MSWFSDLFKKYVAFTAVKIGELGGLDKLQPLRTSMHDLERMRTDYTKLTAKSPGMRIDFAYNFSSVTYPAPPLSDSRSQHSRPFEIFSFSSIHSNILSPLVQRSFYPWSLQRSSCWYDFAGFFKPRREPWSTLIYFAGEATSEDWHGSMQGAYFTGKKQGQRIADDFLQKKLERNEL